MNNNLQQAADGRKSEIITLCQRLIGIPSMPGEEKQIAEFVCGEMQRLNYDRAWIDGAGNVIGYVAGENGGVPGVMLVTHLDHVDTGDRTLWQHDPFGGELVNGRIYGRGASDIKGALAAQIMAPVLLQQTGGKPKRNVFVVSTVLEENGGLGMRYLLTQQEVQAGCAVIGEPSGNEIRLGHRGRLVVSVRCFGRSAHASAPERGINPHYSAARFLLNLEKYLPELSTHPELGQSSIAPTLYQTNSVSMNVIPDYVDILLDWRTTSETMHDGVGWIERIIREAGIEARAEVPRLTQRSWTGYEEKDWPVSYRSFLTAQENQEVQKFAAVFRRITKREPQFGIWRFATDGRLTAQAGIMTFGFGPGEEAQAHVVDESIGVEQLLEAAAVYAGFCLESF
ncbi:MAG: M20/M25/M40 family metallo-hydrolase [candidate division KSB1 bacterium]|nr:M20/M25/M40 family metallo-hydrolase [candidate division KSB1 bacterium]MDZ7303381.1 M20/M25/M40 family metallo-hydrolase [candidate division KSB1 bacterium]MDZ7312301.1 M20/M25/M40 family metallo-hydrolase [candidate division KSB1 bacterium]